MLWRVLWRRRQWWAGLVLLAHAACCSRIDFPPQHQRVFDTPILGKFVGSQERLSNILYAPLTVVASDLEVDCAVVRGSVVYLDKGDELGAWWWREIWDTALEVQRCNGTAVLFRHDFLDAFGGFFYYTTDYDCCKDAGDAVTIPVLTVWHEDMREVARDIRENNQTALVSLTEATTPWADQLYDQPLFVAVARGAMPALNFLVALFALRGLVHHTKAPVPPKNSRLTVFQALRPHIKMALFLVFVGAVIRGVYLAVCPYFSNANLDFQTSNMLLAFDRPLQIPVIIVASALYKDLASTKLNKRPPKKRHVAPWVLVCTAFFALNLTASYGRGYRVDYRALGLVSTLLYAVVTLASVLFAALPLVLRIHHSNKLRRTKSVSKSTPASARSRRRFTLSVVFGTLGLVLQVASSGMLLFGAAVFVPALWATILLLSNVGLVMTAFFYTLAFGPGVVLFRRKPKRTDKSFQRGHKPLRVAGGASRRNDSKTDAESTGNKEAASSREWVWEDMADEEDCVV